MKIDIMMLFLWIDAAFVITTFSSIQRKDNIFEFINRFTFVAFFNVVIFLLLTKVGFI